MKLYEFLVVKTVMITVYIVISAFLFDFLLQVAFGKDVPFYADAVVGLFFGWITSPLAIVAWIVSLCGVSTPFFSN